MIKIRIRNADHEIDVQFPISENKLYAKLAEIHAIEGKDAPQSAFVTEVYWPEELSMLKDRIANLDELNYLARRVESFDYHEYDQFLIGITKLENPTEKDLINLTFNLDHFTLCKDVSSYLVTPGNEKIGVDPKNYTAEYNSEAMKQDEQVKKGNIAIIKHTDDGQTQIETPEEGAEFAVYLKSAGSYDNAKDSERDYLVCDENGFAQTKDLPYGRYTVQQIKGWEGRELLKPFDVFVSENGETYRYLINNANFYSYVKVVKIDSTTGNTIPCSGIGFHIYDPSGNQIQMTFTYPTVTTIDTFYTDGDGMLITPEKLEYGRGYSLVEVSAPYGYVLNSDPVYFDITEENSSEENAVTVVVVTKENAPQMGVITVEKTGEYLASVIDTKDSKRLVYEVGGLAGAEYTVTAAEDIYTPDGTLRYGKDEVVATLVTKKDGKAVTEPLFLGRFHVVETKAPYGMILNPTVQTVELTYAGQEVEITETSTGFYNERQKIEIDLNKVMEQNEVFGVGNNGEITSVNFGLFAAEEIVAADGSSIPAGWVLEVVACDENEHAAFTTDLPVGAKTYVKEISTDSHYILSDKEYPVVFEYAGQEVATVHITVNDGKDIPNELIYGTIKGYKVNRETGDKISGALFGLFRADETSFTENNAFLTAESGEDGVFTFENVVYGSYTVRELRPAAGYARQSITRRKALDTGYPGSLAAAQILSRSRLCYRRICIRQAAVPWRASAAGYTDST